MNDNVKRLMNRIEEYRGLLRLSRDTYYDYKKIVQTNDAIQLYLICGVWNNIVTAMMMHAMIELGIDKKLSVYEEQDNGGYELRVADFRDSLFTPIEFFRALYFANLYGSPILYRNLLELHGKDYLKQLKQLLSVNGSYISDVECRRELINFIKSHTIEKEIGL